MPEPDDQIAITLSREGWLELARLPLATERGTGYAAFLMRAIRPGCRNGHGPEERYVRPSGDLRCHACQRAAGARQRAKARG